MIDFNQGLYAGEFRHNLDSKRRLTVPSKWRSTGDEAQTFLAFPDPAGCVTVYPPQMVNQLKEKISSISIGDKVGRRAITKLLSSADSFSFDKSGRININDRLFQHAGIEKEVVLAGTVNFFQLWSPDRYEQYINGEDEDDGDLADILAGLGF
ncbi:MAG: division/cell wall cluster transcriptional repressor MraZ [Puniceicoccales bacterium]